MEYIVWHETAGTSNPVIVEARTLAHAESAACEIFKIDDTDSISTIPNWGTPGLRRVLEELRSDAATLEMDGKNVRNSAFAVELVRQATLFGKKHPTYKEYTDRIVLKLRA